MDKSSENPTREQVKQRIADEITKVREVINTEMENIRKIQGAENKSLDRDKIYFFDKEGREIKTTGELGGEVEGKKCNLLEKNIPEGTVKIVTAGDLVVDRLHDKVRNLEEPVKVIAAGNIGIGASKAEMFSGGNITVSHIQHNSGALGTIDVGEIDIRGEGDKKVVAGCDINIQNLSKTICETKLISGHNIDIEHSDNGTKENVTALATNNIYAHITDNDMYHDPTGKIDISAEKAYFPVHYYPSQKNMDHGEMNFVKTENFEIIRNSARTPSSEVRDPMVLRSGRAHSLENIDLPITSRAR